MRNSTAAPIFVLVFAAILALPAPSRAETLEVPVTALTVWGPAEPTEAETLAVQHLVREVARATRCTMPVSWGGTEPAEYAILIGNRGTVPHLLTNLTAPPGQHPEHVADVTSQSFVTVALPGSRILAAGWGTERTARGLLGMSYAIGSLLESLDLRNGVWSFQLMVMTMHNVSNRPGVWSVGRALYGSINDWHELADSFAHYEAKGEAYQPYLDILLADEAVAVIGSAAGQTDPQANYAAQDQHITAMESAWIRLQPQAAQFRGNIDQVAGFVAAQRWYWSMAKCTDEAEFTRLYQDFTNDLSPNPEYAHFVQRVPSREDAGFQAYWVWRYFVWDKNNKTGMAPVVTKPEEMLQHERPATDGDKVPNE